MRRCTAGGLPDWHYNWKRAYKALSDALVMYKQLHPDKFATIIIDDPSGCFPSALSVSKERYDLSDRIISDLTTLAVIYSCDKPTARVIFASSSAGVERLSACGVGIVLLTSCSRY